MNEKHVIFGAGPVGRGIARELVAKGLTPLLVSRKGVAVPGATSVAADASQPDRTLEAAKGAATIYHCVNADYTRWAQLLPPIYESILAAAVKSGAKLVVADNLYAYGPTDSEMTESTPENATGPKGLLRKKLSDQLLSAHRAGKARVAILRASDFYGPGDANAFMGKVAIDALSKGKPAPIMGKADIPHAFTYVQDVSRAMTIAGFDDRAFGRVWHVPTLPAIAKREMIERIAAGLGVKPKIQILTPALVGALGLFMPLMREFKENFYMWDRPYRLNSDAFRQTFGMEPTPIEQGIEAMIQDFRDRN